MYKMELNISPVTDEIPLEGVVQGNSVVELKEQITGLILDMISEHNNYGSELFVVMNIDNCETGEFVEHDEDWCTVDLGNKEVRWQS